MAITGSSAIGGIVGRSYKNRSLYKTGERTQIMAMRGGRKKPKKKKSMRGGRRRK